MYYLIKEQNTLLITTNTEDFGADTNAVLIDSDKDIRELSKEAFNGLLEKIESQKKKITGLGLKLELNRDQNKSSAYTIKKLVDANEQLSEQLQQLNFSK